jgi:molecular chaperone DnaK (HSP70)
VLAVGLDSCVRACVALIGRGSDGSDRLLRTVVGSDPRGRLVGVPAISMAGDEESRTRGSRMHNQ